MKKMTLSRIALGVFTLGYLSIATIYFASVGNTEFLGYIAAVTVLLVLVVSTLKWTHFPDRLLWALSILEFLHILGGGMMVGGDVLYNYVVVPLENPAGLTFLKVDQIVHTYGSAVAALFMYFVLARNSTLASKGLFVMTVLAACGVGALNEVLEFIAKLNVPDSNVGGYYNTAVDLSVNLGGAILGALLGLAAWKKVRKTS